MSATTKIEIRDLVISCLKQRLDGAGIDINNISDDDDLYDLGAIDSYDVVDILSQIEKETEITADLEDNEDKLFVLSINWFVSTFYKEA